MTFLEKLEVIERIDGLIKKKGTGSANELASRLGVSRRCVYNILNVMKDMGAPIEFCSVRKSYYYSQPCNLSIGFINTIQVQG